MLSIEIARRVMTPLSKHNTTIPTNFQQVCTTRLNCVVYLIDVTFDTNASGQVYWQREKYHNHQR